MAHNQKLHLPILFLEIPGDAHVQISQNEQKTHLKLQSDQIFVLRDENALLQNMGLPKTTDDDIRRVFDSDIAQYLKTQMLIDTSKEDSEEGFEKPQ